MGLASWASLLIQLEKRNEEFQKKNNKEEYIKFLLESNQMLIAEYNELFQEFELFKSENTTSNQSKFNEYHLEILSIANKEDEGINTYHIEQLYSQSPEYQIAFSELEDMGYIKLSHSFGAALFNTKTVHVYNIIMERKTEVLRELSKANKL